MDAEIKIPNKSEGDTKAQAQDSTPEEEVSLKRT